MDEDANIYDVSFSKSVIRSVASLTYDAAQVMIDNNNEKASPVDASVIMLNKLAKILKRNRIEQGALTLASPEVKFKLDLETMNPTDVAIYAHKEANSLVEEFMLLANITVAKKTLKHFPTLSILRRHQPPSIEQFRPLLIAASIAGFSLDVSNSRALADSLDAAVRADDPFFNKLLRMLSTRCMMPAQYFCSGEIPKDQWHHYGLATHVYTHFTSPIRRYADVLVHRLLAASIGVASLPTVNSSRSLQQEQSTHMNRRHKAAQYAQRASIQLYTQIFFRGKVSVEEGYITSVAADSINVFIPKYGIENSMRVSDVAEVLGADKTHFIDEGLRLEFFAKNCIVRNVAIFEKVTIELRGAESMDAKEPISLHWLNNK
jgi:exosome complex exonuclease DIS3/RRP44